MSVERMRTSRVVALAIIVGAFFTAQEVFMDLARRRPELVRQDILNGLQFWLVWAALTPLVLVVGRRFPLEEKPVYRPLGAHLLAALALSIVHNFVALALDSIVLFSTTAVTVVGALTRNFNPTAFVWGVFTGVVFYTMIVLTFAVFRFRGLYVAERIGAAELEAELTRSKLESLRSQLRPHFLFNTLNAISVFVTEDAAKAQQMILRLATLLRRSLDEEAHEVSLQRELVFVNDYLDIQRERFGDRLHVQLAVDPGVLRARVPIFMLQPLLENAIEHGRSDEERAAIELTAGREREMLHITLADDGPGIDGAAVAREGIGLSNTRARLRHLYGTRATVEVGAARAGTAPRGTRVEIRIPFVEAVL